MKEPLNFGISIYSPVSNVPESANFYYLQPFVKGHVFASTAVLIAAQIFLFIANRLLRNENLHDLGNGEKCASDVSPLPLAVGLSIWGDFTDQSFSPSVFILVPLFTLTNVYGPLPILILELLTAIFSRTAPSQTGSSIPCRLPASSLLPKKQKRQ